MLGVWLYAFNFLILHQKVSCLARRAVSERQAP